MGLLDTMTADEVVRHGVKVYPHVVEPKPQPLTASVVVWWLSQMSPDALESVAQQIVTADRAKAEYLDDALACALGNVRTVDEWDGLAAMATAAHVSVIMSIQSMVSLDDGRVRPLRHRHVSWSGWGALERASRPVRPVAP